jgi:hypothetical protein
VGKSVICSLIAAGVGVLSSRFFAVAPQAEREAVEDEMRHTILGWDYDATKKAKQETHCMVKVANGVMTTLLFAFLPASARRIMKQVHPQPLALAHVTKSQHITLSRAAQLRPCSSSTIIPCLSCASC